MADQHSCVNHMQSERHRETENLDNRQYNGDGQASVEQYNSNRYRGSASRTPTPPDPPTNYGEKVEEDEMRALNQVVCNTQAIITIVNDGVGLMLVPESYRNSTARNRHQLCPDVTVFFTRKTMLNGKSLDWYTLTDLFSPGDRVDCTIAGGALENGKPVGLRFCTGIIRPTNFTRNTECQKDESALICRRNEDMALAQCTGTETVLVLGHIFPRDELLTALVDLQDTQPSSLEKLREIAKIPSILPCYMNRTVKIKTIPEPGWGDFPTPATRLAVNITMEEPYQSYAFIEKYQGDGTKNIGVVLKDCDDGRLVFLPYALLPYMHTRIQPQDLTAGSMVVYEGCPELPNRMYKWRACTVILCNEVQTNKSSVSNQPEANSGSQHDSKSDLSKTSDSEPEDENDLGVGNQSVVNDSASQQVSMQHNMPSSTMQIPDIEQPTVVGLDADLSSILSLSENQPKTQNLVDLNESVGSSRSEKYETPVKAIDVGASQETNRDYQNSLTEPVIKKEAETDLLIDVGPEMPHAMDVKREQQNIKREEFKLERSSPTQAQGMQSFLDMDISSLTSDKFFSSVISKPHSANKSSALTNGAGSTVKTEIKQENLPGAIEEFFLTPAGVMPTSNSVASAVKVEPKMEPKFESTQAWLDLDPLLNSQHASAESGMATETQTPPTVEDSLKKTTAKTSISDAAEKKDSEDGNKMTPILDPSGSGKLLVVDKKTANQIAQQQVQLPSKPKRVEMEPPPTLTSPVDEKLPVRGGARLKQPKTEPVQTVVPPPTVMSSAVNLETLHDMGGRQYLESVDQIGATTEEMDTVGELQRLSHDIFDFIFRLD